MSKLFFNSDGEPRIVEQQLKTKLFISKSSHEVKTPQLDTQQTCVTIFVDPDFNAILPLNHRMVIPTGLTFDFAEGFIGTTYSIPSHITNQGIYVVSQIVKTGEPVNLTVLNFGAQDRAIFCNMPIAQIVLSMAPRITRLVLDTHEPPH